MSKTPLSDLDKNKATKFADHFIHRDQQMKSRLYDIADVQYVSKASEATLEHMSPIDPRKAAGKYPRVELMDLETARRRVSFNRYYVNVPLDNIDVITQIINPESDILKECVNGFKRLQDELILKAALADVVEVDRDGRGNILTAEKDGVKKVTSASASYDAIKKLNRTWSGSEVSNVRKCVPIDEAVEEALLGEENLISGDFISKGAVSTGNLPMVLGHEFKVFGQQTHKALLQKKSGVLTVPVIADGGVSVRIWQNFQVMIEKRSEFLQTKQLQLVFVIGVIRRLGTRVIQWDVTSA